MLALSKASDGLLEIWATNDDGDTKVIPLIEYSWLEEDGQRTLLQPLIDYFNGRRYATQIGVVDQFRKLGKVLGKLGIRALPDNEKDWQDFLLQVFAAWFERAGTATVRTRVIVWNSVFFPYFVLLRDVCDVIPLSAIIPEGSRRLTSQPVVVTDNLLGSSSPTQTFRTDQTVVTIDLTRSDSQYLDEIRDSLSLHIRMLEECCDSWWAQIEEHFKYGQALIAETSWSEIEQAIQEKNFRTGPAKRGGRRPHFANGRTRESFGRLLSLLATEHDQIYAKSVFENSDC